MVMVRLMGGIGNQMFQYAAARRLAYIHNCALKLDLGWFDEIAAADTARVYDLHVFAITGTVASLEEVNEMMQAARSGWRLLLARARGRLTGAPVKTYTKEKNFHFDSEILMLPDDVYLSGYWQSEKYFSDIADILRREFTVKTPPEDRNEQTVEMIRKTQSVSIHVRRGDYVTNPFATQYHGTCTLDYYRDAMEFVGARVEDPHFFVFSDDPAWARENLVSGHPTNVVDCNGPDRAYEDMRLMSLCRHHIIANSSFSWWGAWLCKNPDKIVIAPARWFANAALDTRDLLPERWIRI